MSVTTLPNRDHLPSPETHDEVLYDSQFAFLFGGQLCFVLSNMVLTHYARWVEFLGGSVADVGWVMGLGAGLALVARPWIGQLINQVGTRKVWNIGLVVFGISILSNVCLHSMSWPLHFLRASMMIGNGLVYISALTHIAQRAPRHRQTEAFATFGSAGFVAIMAGPYLGDLILGAGQRTRADYLWLFCISAGLTLFTIFLWSFVKPLQLSSSRTSVGIKEFYFTSQSHWPGAVVLVCIAFGISMTVPFVFLPSFVDHSLNSTSLASPVGCFFLIYGGWGLFVRIMSRAVADRIGRRKILCLGLLIMAVGLWSFLFMTPERWWLLFVPAILTGTGHALCFPAIHALILGPFPKPMRGTGSALFTVCADLGAFIGAPLLGTLANHWGFSGIFLVAGATSLFAFLFYAWWSVPIWREQWNAAQA